MILHAVADRPNGVLVSAGDKYLFVAGNNNDTRGGARKLWRFHLRANGEVDPATGKLIFDWEDGCMPRAGATRHRSTKSRISSRGARMFSIS